MSSLVQPAAPAVYDTTAPASLEHAVVLIPAWQPEPALIPLVASLLDGGIANIILVDDGSGPAYAPLYAQICSDLRVHLLSHPFNRGKGCSLKTGLRYVLQHLPVSTTVITADADGQHLPADILRVAYAAQHHDAAFLLGARAFSGNVPARSRFGNTLTRRLFALFTRIRLTDTQTGLRAFSRNLLPDLVLLPGDRYEYEMTVLAHLCRQGHRPTEVPIQTVYLDGNRSSHFHPLLDSLRIYATLFRTCVLLRPQRSSKHPSPTLSS